MSHTEEYSQFAQLSSFPSCFCQPWLLDFCSSVRKESFTWDESVYYHPMVSLNSLDFSDWSFIYRLTLYLLLFLLPVLPLDNC